MSGSPTPPTTMGDPVVPILDIPPDENLGLSEETVAAVTAVAPEVEEAPAAAEPALVEKGDVQGTTKPAPVEPETAMATISTTTTTTTVTTILDAPDSNAKPSGVEGGEEKDAGEGAKSVSVEKVVEESRVPVTIEAVPSSEGGVAVEFETNSHGDGNGSAAAEVLAASEGSEPIDIVLRKETTTTVTIVADLPPALPADANVGGDLIIGEAAAAGLEEGPSILETMPALGKTKREDEEEVAAVVADEPDAVDGSLEPPSKKVKSDADADVKEEAEDVVMMTEVVLVPVEKVEEGVEAAQEVQESVQLGPKTFNSGVEMFQYFYNLLHTWAPNAEVNKYEQMVLLDLIRKGHRDPEAKIGPGIKSFQVRFHPGWHSRCYYLTRTDGSVDDFSYRKCVDKVMPLPENLYSPSGDLDLDKVLGEKDKWEKGRGKGVAREARDGQGGKNRGRGGRWRGRGGDRWSR